MQGRGKGPFAFLPSLQLLHMCLVSHFDDGRRLSHTCFETRGPIVKFAQCRWLKMKEGIALFQDPSLTVVLVPKWMVKAQDVPSCGNFQSLPLPGLIGRLRLKISLIKGRSEESYRALLRMRRTCQQPDAR